MTVTAAPTGVGKLVISELRFRGPSGASDEFIELFNAGTAPLNISGYTVDGNTNNSTAWATRATVPANTTLQPKQFYLLTNSSASGYSFPGVTGNLTYTTGFTDNRAVRVKDTNSTVLDLVGFATAGTSSAALCEGTCLADASTSNPAGQASFKRKVVNGTLQDTDNNAADFDFTATGANPQNQASIFNNAN